MPKKPKSSSPKSFDIHRNLPDLSRLPQHEIEPRGRLEPYKKRRWTWKKVSLIFFLVILAAFLFIGIWDARNISRASQKLFGSSNFLSLLAGGSLKTDQNDRVNVLVVGYSVDDPGHAGATLTDSIMLLSLDPATKTGFMLSIPRDLYVKTVAGNYTKINQVHQDSGMAALEEVVSSDFGLPISYHMLINYSSVRDSVNALDGIDVTINSPDGRLYDPNIDWSTGGPLVDLANGTHHLNGQQALNLTRARGDSSQSVGFEMSDFQRTADQRLVFTAIKDKISWKLILDPRKNSKVIDAFAGNIKTDVQASEARPLFGLFNRVNTQNLKSITLNNINGKNYLKSTTTFYGSSALIPAAGLNDYSDIQRAISQFE